MGRPLLLLATVAAALALVPTGLSRPLVPPIHFSVPAQLQPATVGQPYQFSFCQPAPQARGRCGVPSGATNPSGGYEHYYVFSLHLSVLPSGLHLSNRSGLLFGSVAKPGSFRFTVCVTDAERRPGVAPKPSCRKTSLNVSAPPPAPASTSFAGAWNGTFQTTSVAPNSCGSSATGTVQLNLAQSGQNVTGNMTYNVTGFTANPNAPSDCENLSPSGSIPVAAAVTGTTLTGSGFTLTQTSSTALSGTFSGTVQGFQLTVTITANHV